MTSGGDRPPLSTEDWMNQLGEHESGNAAMLAFRWAQFPAGQAYQPGGDWNQGMLSVGLAPGATFDLNTSWHVDGQQFTGVLNNVRCARENH